MATAPQVLSAFAKTHLQMIEDRLGDLALRVREETGSEALAAIEKSTRLSWLPLDHHVRLTEASFLLAPGSRSREICCATVLASFDQPFMKPIVSGAFAVLGGSFGRFVTWTPKAWPALFRGVGELRWVADGPNEGRLVLENASPKIAGSPAYVEGLAGAFSALFEVTGCSGRVAARAAPGCVELQLDW
ncbi:MAG: hypothetical protein CL910_05655 [Deltaproteobacteria bacterium]|jgi:hypothetical protein|nr:hypothetical protein [Deltaproteobacteria bacterium]